MKTMPLPEIISALRKITGCPQELAERFLLEFEAVITDRLIADGTVTVAGIGSFRRIDTPEGAGVAFLPDTALAEAVNAPFAIFEPIELDDDVTVEMLDDAAQESDECNGIPPIAEPPSQPESEEEPISRPVINQPPLSEPEAGPTAGNDIETNETDTADVTPEPVVEQKSQSGTDALANEDAEPETSTQETGTEELTPENSTEASCPQKQSMPPEKTVTYEKVIEKEKVVNVVDKSRHAFHTALASILSLIIGLIIGYFAYGKLNLNGVKSVNISAEDVQIYQSPQPEVTTQTETSGMPVDTIPPGDSGETSTDEQPEKVSSPQTPVTDTVKSNRFLTTMAQEHYGKKKFWVYIYKENEAKLDDPDKIAPQTVVIIPPAEKYGIKPGDRASEDEAERMAQEILGKFNRN